MSTFLRRITATTALALAAVGSIVGVGVAYAVHQTVIASSDPQQPTIEEVPAPVPPRTEEQLTPAAADLPLARPRPTAADLASALGHDPDYTFLWTVADLAASVVKHGALFGSTGGVRLIDLVWGDVENYQSGAQAVDQGDVVIRLVRAHATNGQRYFEIAAISAKTGRLLTSTTSMTDGGDRPNSFTYDVASTVWAD